jgi:hypothetical protein
MEAPHGVRAPHGMRTTRVHRQPGAGCACLESVARGGGVGGQVRIFVVFGDEASAAKAVAALDKRWFAGKSVQVRPAHPSQPRRTHSPTRTPEHV